MQTLTDKREWPWCAKCNKPVEQVDVVPTFMTVTGWNGVPTHQELWRCYELTCHGEKESMRIPIHLIEEGRLSWGTAFKDGD